MAVTAAVAVAATVSVTACPSPPPPKTPSLPPPPCDVLTRGLAAPTVGGLRPAVAATAGRFAVAWLELGDRDAIDLAVLDEHGDPVVPPFDAAPGFSALSPPRLAATTDGFLLAFGGRDPAGAEGLATAAVSRAAVAAAPRVAVPAEGGPRALALAVAGGRTFVGWSAWMVDSPTVNVTILDGPTVALDAAPHEPVMQLVPLADGVRAAWLARGADAEADDQVRGATLDGEARPRDRFAAGPGTSLALAAPGGGDLLLVGRGGRLSLARLVDGAPHALPPPEGRLGVLVAHQGGALACSTRPSPLAEGEEIHCLRLDAAGERRDETAVAGGAIGVRGLAAASDGTTAIVGWQQDDAEGNGMVAVALLRCR